MNMLSQTGMACGFGSIVLFAAMVVVDELFWAHCGGIDIHQWPNIWVCWHLSELQVICSLLGGAVGGIVNKSRGLIIGPLTALFGFAIFTFLVRYPFGTDHLLALQNGFLLFILPATLACILGEKIKGKLWKNVF